MSEGSQGCASCAEAARERDEARAELALMRALGPKAHEAQRQRDENAELAESLRGELEEAQAQIKALQGLELAASWERDDLRAEVERLRADVSRREREHEALLDTAQKALASASVEREAMEEHVGRMQELIDSVATIVGTPGDDPGDIDGFEVLRLHVRATVDALQIARDDADEARGEVERLRRERNKLISERRQLRARLVECRPWVGVLPYPGTPEFNEMIAIRDLADDTLEEVKQ